MEKDRHVPQIWIFGGANGSGKSSLYDSAICEPLHGLPYVNADKILLDMQISDAPNASESTAGKVAVNKIRELVDSRQDFVVETTLSGHYYSKLVADLKKQGWGINIIIVGCRDIEQSKERIKKRVALGLHDVPDDVVERRWPKTIENTAHFVSLSDRGWLLDNSIDDVAPTLVAKFKDGRVVERTKRHNIPHIFDVLAEQNLMTDSSLHEQLETHGASKL